MLILTVVWFSASSWLGTIIQQLIDDWNRIHGGDDEWRKPRAPKNPPPHGGVAAAKASDPDPVPWRAGASDPQPIPLRIALRGLALAAGVAAGIVAMGVQTRSPAPTDLAAAGLIAFGVSFAVGSLLGLVRVGSAATLSKATPAVGR
jgi:hypothetical protein